MSNENYKYDTFVNDDKIPNETTRIISDVDLLRHNYVDAGSIAAPYTGVKDEQNEALLLLSQETIHTHNIWRIADDWLFSFLAF
jgi:hypothetical protein